VIRGVAGIGGARARSRSRNVDRVDDLHARGGWGRHRNIFGLRMLEFTEPKQQAARRAQELINELSDDISTAWLVEVGNGAVSTFVPVPRGLKVGNALKNIPDGSDTNDFVVYYKDPNSDELLRTLPRSRRPPWWPGG
jgi:hypothetical protein